MRLKTKIALILVLPMLLLLGVLAALLRSEVMSRFVRLERDELVQNHQRLEQAIEAEFDALRRLTRDWAYFDDTYDFIAGDNPEWVEANFAPATFDNLQLDGIVLFDRAGGLVSGFAYDEDSHSLGALDRALTDRISALVLAGHEPQRQGVMLFQGRVLQLAMSEVRDSDGAAESNGTLVMMRFHEQGEVDKLAQRIRLRLQFAPLSGAGSEQVDAAVLEGLRSGSPWLRIEGDDAMSSYSMLDDLQGQPALVMQVSMPRDIYREGQRAVQQLLLFALGAQLLLAGGTFVAIHRAALQRLSGMARRLRRMGTGTDDEQRLRAKGNDEIDQVSRSINAMLDGLRDAEMRRRAAGERQRRLNALLVDMATDDSIIDGEIGTLLEALRRSIAEGVRLAGWSLWLDDDRSGLVCLGESEPGQRGPVDPTELAPLLQEPATRSSKLIAWPRSDERDPRVQIFPFTVEAHTGLLCAWMDDAQRFEDDELNFLIAAAQLVERAVLAHRLAARESELKQKAEADPLTGLANRAGFERELRHRLASVDAQHLLGLLFIDLDRFKPVNDQYGHAVGDWLLQQVALRIRDRLRSGDMVSRLGGDEFTVVLSALKSPGDASRVAEKLVQALTEPFQHAAGDIRIGCSIGIACAPLHATAMAELVEVADHAMYRAKQAGRGAWHYAAEP